MHWQCNDQPKDASISLLHRQGTLRAGERSHRDGRRRAVRTYRSPVRTIRRVARATSLRRCGGHTVRRAWVCRDDHRRNRQRPGSADARCSRPWVARPTCSPRGTGLWSATTNRSTWSTDPRCRRCSPRPIRPVWWSGGWSTHLTSVGAPPPLGRVLVSAGDADPQAAALLEEVNRQSLAGAPSLRAHQDRWPACRTRA